MKRRRKTPAVAAAQPQVEPNKPAAAALTVRLEDDLPERLEKGCKLVKLDKSTLVRVALDAVLRVIERDGGITVPLNLVAAPRGPVTLEV